MAAPVPGNGSNRWTMIIAAGALALSFGGNIWSFALSGTTTAQQVVSQQGQLDDIKRRLGQIEESSRTEASAVVKIQSDLTRVETQFCNSSNIVNLMHSKELSILAPLFHKAFGETYPTDLTTYPRIGSCE